MTTVPGGTETFYELTLDTAAGNKLSSCTPRRWSSMSSGRR
jgi:hypothetical protein